MADRKLTSVLEHVGKLSPQSVQTEEAVLGALMLERNALDVIIQLIVPDTFYNDKHREIYEAILSLHKKDQPIDLLTVVNELRSTGRLEHSGGTFYISELTNRVSSAANIMHHALIIQQKYMDRRLISVSSDIMRDSYDEMSGDVFDRVDAAIKELEQLRDIKFDKAEQKLVDVAREIKHSLSVVEEKPSGIPSGFKKLDNLIGPWMNGSLILIAARPGHGKTSCVLNILRNFSELSNINVAIFSYEMKNNQLTARILAQDMDISAGDILRKNLLSHDVVKLDENIAKLDALGFYMDDNVDDDIVKVIKKMRSFKKKYNIGAFAIDYLQIIPSLEADRKGKMTNRDSELGVITRKLKKAAMELDVPIIALSQLSRKLEERKGEGSKRPILSDLRDSGNLEQDADMVLFIYRPEEYGIDTEIIDGIRTNTAGLAEIIVAKNRYGAHDKWVPLKWTGKTTSFSDWGESEENLFDKNQPDLPF